MHPLILFQRPHESSSLVKNFIYRTLGYPHIGTRIRGTAVFSLFHLPLHTKILDIGCGRGYFSYELARRGYDVTSLDSFKGIRQQDIASLRNVFRKGGKKLKFIDGNATSLPFSSESFDCVFIIDVIEHIPDDHKVLQEIHRVLKKEGILIISTPTVGFHSGKFKWLFRRLYHSSLFHNIPIWNEQELDPQTMMRMKGHLREYSKEKWKHLLHQHSFTFEDSREEYKFFGGASY